MDNVCNRALTNAEVEVAKDYLAADIHLQIFYNCVVARADPSYGYVYPLEDSFIAINMRRMDRIYKTQTIQDALDWLAESFSVGGEE